MNAQPPPLPKKSNKVKTGCLGCLGLFFLMVIFGKIVGPQDSPAPSVQHTATPDSIVSPSPVVSANIMPSPIITPEPTPSPSPSPSPVPTPLSITDYAKSILEKSTWLGSKNEISIEYIPPDADGPGVLNVRYYLGTQWSSSSAKDSIISNSKDIFEKLYSDPSISLKVELINIISSGDFQDKYGNSTRDIAGRISLSKPVANKINWKNILDEQYLNVISTEGTIFYIHPALNK